MAVSSACVATTILTLAVLAAVDGSPKYRSPEAVVRRSASNDQTQLTVFSGPKKLFTITVTNSLVTVNAVLRDPYGSVTHLSQTSSLTPPGYGSSVNSLAVGPYRISITSGSASGPVIVAKRNKRFRVVISVRPGKAPVVKIAEFARGQRIRVQSRPKAVVSKTPAKRAGR